MMGETFGSFKYLEFLISRDSIAFFNAPVKLLSSMNIDAIFVEKTPAMLRPIFSVLILNKSTEYAYPQYSGIGTHIKG